MYLYVVSSSFALRYFNKIKSNHNPYDLSSQTIKQAYSDVADAIQNKPIIVTKNTPVVETKIVNIDIKENKSKAITEELDECLICLLKINQRIVLVPCGHTQFHGACIDQLKKMMCPVCRKDIVKYMSIYL